MGEDSNREYGGDTERTLQCEQEGTRPRSAGAAASKSSAQRDVGTRQRLSSFPSKLRGEHSCKRSAWLVVPCSSRCAAWCAVWPGGGVARSRLKYVTEFYQHPHVFLIRTGVGAISGRTNGCAQMRQTPAKQGEMRYKDFFCGSSFFLYDMFALLVLIRNDRTTSGVRNDLIIPGL